MDEAWAQVGQVEFAGQSSIEQAVRERRRGFRGRQWARERSDQRGLRGECCRSDAQSRFGKLGGDLL
jgi:hypothetical protein